MSNVEGMDIEAGRLLAGHLNDRAHEIDILTSALTTELTNLQWLGPDADSFRHEWDTNYQAQLHNIAAMLRDVGGRVTANATQQETASSH